ncbi:MAG: biotin--[Clostridia bacterium]|nr:biotin--[acetyl-CoA-carboxylase] ligase [Clostridia bacterium]
MLKEDILTCLRQGGYVSGEQLARRFAVSRNAVWKAVMHLRKEGYAIDSVTNRGYCLTAAPDILQIAELQSCLGAQAGLYEIFVYDRIDSTNREAMERAAAGAAAGTVILADTQTAGRGRLGRSFYSPPGTGIYMSVILRPDLPLSQLPLITACAGTAVAAAVDRLYGTDTGIKWVNDLYLGGKKFCGILSQASIDMERGTPEAVIIGIGINAAKGAFPDEIAEIAVSLEEAAGKRVRRAQLIGEILKNCADMEAQIRSRSFLAAYKRRSVLLGKEITVHAPDGIYTAVATDIDENAALLVTTADGSVKRVDSGEVSVRIFKGVEQNGEK